MLGARYRKVFEARERKQKEHRVKRFVTKRSRMHWGVYSMAGDQLPCTYTTAKVRLRGTQAVVELSYRYQLDGANSVEYYFPMCEVPGIDTLQVQFKQGGADTPFVHMTGKLYEQTPDGITKPWEPADEPADDESETQSLLGSFFATAPDPKKDAKRSKDKALFYYFFGTSPELQTLDGTRDILVKVTYVVKCHSEKQQYEDNDVITFNMPLTIFSHTPDLWDIQVQMPDFIRRIKPKLSSQKIFTEITGKRAVCRFHESFPLALEDDMFTMLVELGEPIEPRCADPTALFIFATFIGLMVWFTLTKELH